MSLSRLALSIAESPTLKLNEEARILRSQGQDVINLGIGEPKNRTPIPAILSATSRLSTGDVKYTPTDGLPTLKKAIIGYTEENYGRVVRPENVVVTAGAKQAIHSLLFTLLDPHDEVILMAPYWVSYPEMVRMVGGVPVIVMPEEGTFLPRLQDIKRAITSRTKAVILNSPNNPSGMIFPEEFVAGLVELCERKDLYLIADDIYHKLVFDGQRAAPAYGFTPKDIESSRIIVVNGISKTYGMTGFRIGWAVGPRAVVKVMTNVLAQTTSCASAISQVAAEGALTGSQSYVESLRVTIQNNRDVVMQELTGVSSVCTARPQGAFYCLPDFRHYNQDSAALASFLLKKALVVTVPGKDFGMEGHLRLSFSGSVKDLTEGVARIKWALDPNSPNEIYIGDRQLVRDWL
ncbi:MAG: pyridoxal phosphate-dependent aminotransferase [Chloroflexi bacterium]|nr:pyridoxal phosphate-dependent aminotransferase [Chloroflexota bacterium]